MPGQQPRSETTIDEGRYVSAHFRRFTHAMDRMPPEASVVDLGPSTPENVMFWLQRGRPVSAYDAAARGPGRLVDRIRTDGEVGGILCWSSLCLLSHEEARDLLATLRRLVSPGAVLFAVFDGDGLHEPGRSRYRIEGPDRLSFEAEEGPVPRPVPTREAEALLATFGRSRIMVMRHGCREAFCRAE